MLELHSSGVGALMQDQVSLRVEFHKKFRVSFGFSRFLLKIKVNLASKDPVTHPGCSHTSEKKKKKKQRSWDKLRIPYHPDHDKAVSEAKCGLLNFAFSMHCCELCNVLSLSTVKSNYSDDAMVREASPSH